MRRVFLILPLVLVVAAGCGGAATPTSSARPSASPGAQATPGQPTPGQATATAGQVMTPQPPGALGSTAVHLEVASGKQAGTYDATGVKSDCNVSSTGSGATYLDLEKKAGLSGMTLSAIEGGTSTTKFYFQALFGEVTINQPVVEIQALDPSSARGKGTATLEDKGATIKWSVDGTTEDGIAIKAAIECGPVERR